MRLPTLHVLTDETLQSRFSHRELAVLAARGGADVVQLREKRPIDDSALTPIAARIVACAGALGTRVVVDDRVAVAAESGAAGVHLGRHDTDPAAARSRLGPEAWIGRTVNDRGEAAATARMPVTYLGVGPVFGTRSKARPAPELGLCELARIVRLAGLPVVAIGGISPERVGAVLDTGARGIAVLSGVACAADPAAATARYRDAVDAWIRREERNERALHGTG